MGENIHAVRVQLGAKEIRVRALAANRKGARYTLRATKHVADENDPKAYRAIIKAAVEGILTPGGSE